jgi:hypothetical protein
VLVLAPLLREGAGTLVHPLVAVDLWLAHVIASDRQGRRGNDLIYFILTAKVQCQQ